MNSVAGGLLATMMNSSFTPNQSKSLTGSTESQDFSKVFAKVNSGNNHQTALQSGTDQGRQTPEATTGENTRKAVTKEETPTAEIKEPVVEEKVTEAVEEVKDQVTEITENTVDEDAAVIEAAIEQISQMLGISEETLLTVLNDLNISFEKLAEGEGLIPLIQEVKGLEGTAELLLNEEASEAFKEIKEVVTTLLNDFEGDVEDLGQKFLEVAGKISASGHEASVQTQVDARATDLMKTETAVEPSAEAVETNLEIEDLRTGDQTTKDSQHNGQDQNMNHPSFGELMAQQRAESLAQPADVQAAEAAFVKLNEANIIDQIVTKAIVQLSDEKASMELQLTPGNLGKVAVSVTAEQGMVKGQFVAENQQVKELLETNLIQLKAQLEEQGIKVDKIEVTVGNTNQYFDQREQQQQNQQQKGKSGNSSRRIARLMEADLAESAEMTEAVIPDHIQTLEAHTVEYSA